MKSFVIVGLASVGVLVSVSASAHIQIQSPAQRESAQKAGPCGSSGSMRGANVTELVGGSTYTVEWTEPVNHPAHYRISFDQDGQDDFEDPATMMEFNTNAAVLYDNIADKQGGDYSMDITVPDVDCNNCTLQLIQVMYDKAPYGDGNDIYYQCADITIVSSGNAPDMGGEVDMGTPPECTVDADCDTGEVCMDGMCVDSASGQCVFDSHCQPGEYCNGGNCVVGTAPNNANNANNANNTGGTNNSNPDTDMGVGGGDNSETDDDSGCSAVRTNPTSAGGLLLILGFLGLRRRRRS